MYQKPPSFTVCAIITILAAVSMEFAACAGTPSLAGPDELDAAIREASDYINEKVPQGSKLAIISVKSDYPPFAAMHDTQTVEQREDGSVYVKFTTTQMPAVLRWVLGYTVKVLNLPELVEQVKAECEKVRGFMKTKRNIFTPALVAGDGDVYLPRGEDV